MKAKKLREVFEREVLIDGLLLEVRHLRIRFVKNRTDRCEGLW